MHSKWLGRIGLTALVMGVVGSSGGMVGCAAERDPINRVQLNAIPKSFLVGDDYGAPTNAWYGVAFPKGAPPTTAQSLRDFGANVDPSLAPDGKQIYYVLLPTPHTGAPIDWSVVGPRYRDEAVAHLEARGYVGFGDAIEVEDVTTPADWQARGMERGAPFAAAHSTSRTHASGSEIGMWAIPKWRAGASDTKSASQRL